MRIKRNFSNNNRLAIVTVMHDLSTSPSLLNAINLLVKAGYKIDLIARGHNLSIDYDDVWKNNVFIHLSPWTGHTVISGVTAFRQWLLINKIFLLHRPLAVIAISPEALVLAGPAAIFLNLPLIHFSLEVRFPKNLISSIQKKLEIFLYRFVRFTIIQDKVRAKTLLDSIGMLNLDIIFLPNISGLNELKNTTSNYLRDHWNISLDEIVILYAGSIVPFGMSLELAKIAHEWPQNWRLIIHGWALDPTYLLSVKEECNKSSTILSLEKVAYKQLDELVSSADIGLALYNPLDRNLLDMGQASGKIWQYLRCGLPVITMDFPSLVEMVNEGQFGLCIHNLDELKLAIEKVLMKKNFFSNHAKEFYKNHGDFERMFKQVLERLEKFE